MPPRNRLVIITEALAPHQSMCGAGCAAAMGRVGAFGMAKDRLGTSA
jgi:hypothetical protein